MASLAEDSTAVLVDPEGNLAVVADHTTVVVVLVVPSKEVGYPDEEKCFMAQ